MDSDFYLLCSFSLARHHFVWRPDMFLLEVSPSDLTLRPLVPDMGSICPTIMWQMA